MEKQKFVYILNRDTETNLTISSPLEAHRSHTIVFSCVALDVGFENPLFACLELDYRDMDDPSGPSPPSPEDVEKSLVYYELDLGLNHVVRKGSEPVARSAHHLIPCMFLPFIVPFSPSPPPPHPSPFNSPLPLFL